MSGWPFPPKQRQPQIGTQRRSVELSRIQSTDKPCYDRYRGPWRPWRPWRPSSSSSSGYSSCASFNDYAHARTIQNGCAIHTSASPSLRSWCDTYSSDDDVLDGHKELLHERSVECAADVRVDLLRLSISFFESLRRRARAHISEMNFSSTKSFQKFSSRHEFQLKVTSLIVHDEAWLSVCV